MTTVLGLPARFWDKALIEERGYETACLTWTGYINSGGYGQFRWSGCARLAHRVVHEAEFGPVPDGMVLDHLCRNRACVNVSHLDLVTQRTNLLRGNTVTAANLAKTECPKGHPYTPENTAALASGRRCRACNQERMRTRYLSRKKEKSTQ